MMNEVLFVAEAVVTFSAVVAVGRAFGLFGYMAWVPVAMILANLVTAKSVTLFGVDTCLGTVLFASTFLATDCITELYGAEHARKAVLMGVTSTVAFIVATQVAAAYTPSEADVVDGAMHGLFAVNARVSAASILMCLLANLGNVAIFERLREAMESRGLWFRSNVGAIVCNCVENFAFVALAFAGIYPVGDLVAIALSTSVFEVVLSVADTPFVYLARCLSRPTEGRD